MHWPRLGLRNWNREPVTVISPLNLPSPAILLIEQKESVNIRCWTERETTRLENGLCFRASNRCQNGQTYWSSEAMLLVSPLDLPNLPRTGIEFQECVDVFSSKYPICGVRILRRLWQILF